MNSLHAFILFVLVSINGSAFGAFVSIQKYSSKSGYPIQIQDLHFNCDGENECEMGQEGTFEGQLLFSETLPSDTIYVSCYLEKYYVHLKTIATKQKIELCDSISSESGDECPAAGAYEFAITETIPEIDDFVVGWSVNVVVTAYDTNNNVVGRFEALLPTQSTYSSSQSSRYVKTTVFSVAIGTMLVTMFQIRKKRKLLSASEGDFQMMKDSTSEMI